MEVRIPFSILSENQNNDRYTDLTLVQFVRCERSFSSITPRTKVGTAHRANADSDGRQCRPRGQDVPVMRSLRAGTCLALRRVTSSQIPVSTTSVYNLI